MSGKTRSDKDPASAPDDRTGGLRLDKWLWQARFFKTRTLAGTVVGKGKVRINRMLVTKPHYKVRPGDVLTFAQGREIRIVRVIALGERRGPAPEARTLYENIGDHAGEPAASKPCATRRSETIAGASSPEGRSETSRPDKPQTGKPMQASQKREPWGVKGGIDPRRARKQAIDAKMGDR